MSIHNDSFAKLEDHNLFKYSCIIEPLGDLYSSLLKKANKWNKEIFREMKLCCVML